MLRPDRYLILIFTGLGLNIRNASDREALFKFVKALDRLGLAMAMVPQVGNSSGQQVLANRAHVFVKMQ